MFSLFLIALAVCCTAKSFSPRIVGGEFAAENQFPHQVAIIYGGGLRCGGSIYNHSWVITAAHCLVNGNGKQTLSILAGTNELSRGGVKRNVTVQIPHEDYGNFMNDIALLRLDEPLEFDESLKPIEVLTEEVPSGANVTISGWGKVSNTGGTSEKLKFNILVALDNEECMFSVMDHPSVMCLGHSKGNGACNGDSGGSAMYDGKLCGVANFVMSGCGSTNPDGYAKVSVFADWIQETVAKYEQKSLLILL